MAAWIYGCVVILTTCGLLITYHRINRHRANIERIRSYAPSE
jgi:hypothetical protein